MSVFAAYGTIVTSLADGAGQGGIESGGAITDMSGEGHVARLGSFTEAHPRWCGTDDLGFVQWRKTR